MSDNKIIKQKIDKYQNSKIIELDENDQEETMKMCISAKEFKKKRPTMTASELKKILLDFKNEINTNMVNMEDRITTNVVAMVSDLKTEIKADMINMEKSINSKIINTEERINSRIDNLQDEMNNRFDKLELRVGILESFHQTDFAKN